jgi:hypothetical protein
MGSRIPGITYSNPIVNHEFARKRVLEVYKKALGNRINNKRASLESCNFLGLY